MGQRGDEGDPGRVGAIGPGGKGEGKRLQRVTGEPPRMWGPSIVGFGSYRYRLASGKLGESCATGFAIRGRELVVYLMAAGPEHAALRERLGTHRMGTACLYVKRLADLDLAVLEQLVARSLAALPAVE